MLSANWSLGAPPQVELGDVTVKKLIKQKPQLTRVGEALTSYKDSRTQQEDSFLDKDTANEQPWTLL